MPEETEFDAGLLSFYASNGIQKPRQKATLAKHHVNLFTLYNHVTSQGGYEMVCEKKGWNDAAVAACGPTVLTSSYIQKRCEELYSKRLLLYEQKFFKKDSDGKRQKISVVDPLHSSTADAVGEENKLQENQLNDHHYQTISDDDSDIDDAHHVVLAAVVEIPSLEPLESDDDSRKWLDDGIIHFFLNHLMSQRHNIHAFDIFFYNHLRDKGPDNQLLRWTRRVDIFAKDFVFFPVNLRQLHWTLIVANCKEKTISYYDSMGGGKVNMGCNHAAYEPPSRHMDRVLEYLQREHADKKNCPLTSQWTCNPVGRSEDVPLVEGKIPQQQNSYDCGVFLCKYADCIARGLPFSFSQQDMPEMRNYLKMLIQSRSSRGIERAAAAAPDATRERPRDRIPLISDGVAIPNRKELICALIEKSLPADQMLREIEKIDRKCAVRYWVRTRGILFSSEQKIDSTKAYQSLTHIPERQTQFFEAGNFSSQIECLKFLEDKEKNLIRQQLKTEAKIKRKKSIIEIYIYSHHVTQPDTSHEEELLKITAHSLAIVRDSIKNQSIIF